MELVYLWVEEYKNIKKQGFNFSPRFECKYDEDTNELTIDEKEDYVSIFPDNINVTAIVGENGSGKSSLLEILMLSSFESRNFNIKKSIWLIVYNKINNSLYVKDFKNKNITFNNIKIDNSEMANNSINKQNNKKYINNKYNKIDFYNIYFNPSSELVSSEFLEHCSKNTRTDSASIYDLDFKPQDSLNLFAFPSKKNEIINIRKNENTIILNMYKSMKELEQKNVNLEYILKNIGTNKIYFIPKRVSFSFLLEDAEYQIKSEYFKDIVFQNYSDLSIDSLYAYLITIILSISKVNIQNQKLNTYFFENEKIEKFLQDKLNSIKNKIPTNDIIDPVFKLAKYILQNLEEFKSALANTQSSLSELISDQGKRLNIVVYDISCLIDVLNSMDDKNILNSSLNNQELISKLLPVLPSFIRLDATDKNNVQFSSFSSGEKNIVNIIYSSIYYSFLFSNNNNSINLFIDEIEIGLNPKWQKDIFNIIIKLFTSLHININIFITSHSPFILSDLPKENVIFLEKGEQVDVDIETFGANIHTLLSHGFFMKDGLMGEFAKGQINDAISRLNQTKLSEDDIKFCENIIKITGEPIIKRQMQKMLDSKRLTKIDKLEAEIELMKHRIEMIRKNQ